MAASGWRNYEIGVGVIGVACGDGGGPGVKVAVGEGVLVGAGVEVVVGSCVVEVVGVDVFCAVGFGLRGVLVLVGTNSATSNSAS